MGTERTIDPDLAADPQGRLDALVGPLQCPECGADLQELPGPWSGLIGCLCTWGGRVPSADEVADVAEARERPNCSITSTAARL